MTIVNAEVFVHTELMRNVDTGMKNISYFMKNTTCLLNRTHSYLGTSYIFMYFKMLLNYIKFLIILVETEQCRKSRGEHRHLQIGRMLDIDLIPDLT
jgi:hypothetical protein